MSSGRLVHRRLRLDQGPRLSAFWPGGQYYSLRTRRLPKAWLHVAMSILAMNGSALARVQAGEPQGVRECARKVA